MLSVTIIPAERQDEQVLPALTRPATVKERQFLRLSGAERLRKVSQVIETVLAERIIPRQTVGGIIRDFIVHERRHMAMEERDFFPAAIKALQAEDWAEIAATLTGQKRDPLFSEIVEQRFDVVRKHILQLEQEAEVERA
jgi:hemerythrin-like domain-containing protein